MSAERLGSHFGFRMRQNRAGGPVSCEEFDVWVRWGPHLAGKPPPPSSLAIYQRLCPQLTNEERMAVGIAVDHARHGQGRVEFDEVTRKIRTRLWELSLPKKETSGPAKQGSSTRKILI